MASDGPPHYSFSLKLNKLITHTHRLALTPEVIKAVDFILQSTDILGERKGAILIQLPASFHYDIHLLDTFLRFFVTEVRARQHPFAIAIEFRNAQWFTDELFALLESYNVALVAGQSSRWPGIRRTTATVAYIRMHGPEKLFASSYSPAQLQELADYIQSLPHRVETVYVYFNNDFHGYAIDNAKALTALLAPLTAGPSTV